MNRPVTPLELPWNGLPAGLGVGMLALGAGEEPASEGLSYEERERLAAFSHPDRRRSFVLGRLAARGLLAEKLGLAPAHVPLIVQPSGAPGVEGHPLHVSLAHAGRGADVRAVAAAAGHPVGVDLESAGPRDPRLLARLLGPDERGIEGELGIDPDDAPALVWTLKEAVLKGLGTGLRRGARSVVLRPKGAGTAVADVGEGAPWAVRYRRVGSFWLAVAWAEGERG